MKSPVKLKERKRKRKRINNEKSVFSTSQNIIFPARNNRAETLIKPPFKSSKKDEVILYAVLEGLSKTSTPINSKKPTDST